MPLYWRKRAADDIAADLELDETGLEMGGEISENESMLLETA